MPHFVPWRWQIRTSGSMLHTVMPPPRAQGPENSNRLRTVPIAMSTAHSTRAAQSHTARGNGHRGFLQNKNSALQTVLGKQCGRPLSYDGMIRVRFAGQGVTSPNLSRKHPTPRRRICFAVNSVYPKRNHLSSIEKHAIIASELRIFPEWRPIMSDSLQSLFSRCDSVLVFDTGNERP